MKTAALFSLFCLFMFSGCIESAHSQNYIISHVPPEEEVVGVED